MKTPKGWTQNALPMQLTDIGWEQPEMFEQSCPQCGGQLVVDDSGSMPVVYCETNPDHFRYPPAF